MSFDPKRLVQREATNEILNAFGYSQDESKGGGGGGYGDDGGGHGSGGGLKRVTAVLPGGSGKTVLGLRVAEALVKHGAQYPGVHWHVLSRIPSTYQRGS